MESSNLPIEHSQNGGFILSYKHSIQFSDVNRQEEHFLLHSKIKKKYLIKI